MLGAGDGLKGCASRTGKRRLWPLTSSPAPGVSADMPLRPGLCSPLAVTFLMGRKVTFQTGPTPAVADALNLWSCHSSRSACLRPTTASRCRPLWPTKSLRGAGQNVQGEESPWDFSHGLPIVRLPGCSLRRTRATSAIRRDGESGFAIPPYASHTRHGTGQTLSVGLPSFLALPHPRWPAAARPTPKPGDRARRLIGTRPNAFPSTHRRRSLCMRGHEC